MPLSSAERCRKYREKLKKENPEKFEEMKKKNLERTKAKKRKIGDMSENEKQNVRKQWRDAKRKKLNENKPVVIESERARRRYRSQVGQENKKLKENIKILRRKNENLRKQLKRSRMQVQRLAVELDRLKSQKESRKIIINQPQSVEIEEHHYPSELTPTTKSNIFIAKELPDISEEAKERVKKTLLQQNVLEESLKETYKHSKSIQEKKILKKLTETEIGKKYNMKTSLAKCLGIKSGVKRYYSIKQKRLKTACNLKKFFERDDVSRMTAGKKEYVTKNKIQKQKRFLLDTLLKLYKKYKNEGGTVSFTTFKRYRPFYIVPPNLSTRNTCACIKHSNLTFKAEALKKSGLIKTTDLTDLVSQIVCDVKSKSCMYSECNLCRDKELQITVSADQSQHEVSWYEFISKSHEYEKDAEKKVTKRMVKSQQTGVLHNLVKLIQRDLKSFKVHHYNIYHQYIQYKESIEKLENDEVILHCDFSENYVCKMAQEVQAMHFGSSKIQVTLHTGLLYLKNEKPLCFCTVSPSLKHGPEAIWGHLKPVIDFIKQKFPTVRRIHFWSDGPTTQYRQKYNFFLFCEITQNEGFHQATWSFFEASHGKGAADGVGGVVKRTLDARVAYGKDICDAKSVFEILLQSEISVQTFYVSNEDIEKIKISNPEKILPIPSTMTIHQVIVTENKNTVKYRPLSCFCTRGICDCFSTKIHILIKENIEKQPRVRRFKKKNIRLESSSEDTDTEIEYAESDQSDWIEAEYFDDNDLKEQETCRERIQNKSESEIENDLTTENVIIKTTTEEERMLQVELDSVMQKGSGSKGKKKGNRGSSECHSPVSHSFMCTITTSEKQPNKQSNFEQENEAKKSKNSKKTRRRYISSSTEEDECDDNIEYAESDTSVFFSDGSISPDFNDDENNLTIELDEKTGVLRPKIDPNKKVTVLSTIILKKPNGENYTKQERKRKIICENKDLMPKRFCETKKHVIGKDDVTILSQIRKKPENIASYDLRQSNLFGKEENNVMKRRSNDSNKIKTDNRKIDENKENKNDTKKEIEKTLIEKFVMAEKHKIEIECTKKDESIEIVNVIGEEEIKVTEENKNNDTIKTEYKKQHERMRGQNNTGDDLQEAAKYKEIDKIESDEINKSENLKEDKSDKESNLNKEERKMIIESEENTQNFILNINDSIIVRYFQRNTWKYFIGFVENIEFKDGENYYKVKFLKTVKDIKSDSVKFVVQRKLDVDIVTNISIVKKVNLIQREEASKEYYLSTDFDMVYFS